ncbi:hypothetical protein [Kribbella sp. NPDC049227]|uniref:hypothetical protein n=1 Tax=Kribbella sp. NPDC049227 TaxID=3364113 RepID=UPI0037111C53
MCFERGAPRRFDQVIGADGLHSNVRRLVFGAEDQFTEPVSPYGARHLGEARALFLFRAGELKYHYRDVPRQKSVVREAFVGMHPEVDRWQAELDRTPVFYFDSVIQLRMDSWSRGRVTLVGDAGYRPGPAVGGSTSLAVIGA